MKNFQLPFLLAGALLIGSSAAHAERTTNPYDDWFIAQTIPSTNETLPLDKALTALSRDSSLSVFVDATSLSLDVRVPPTEVRVADAPSDKNSIRKDVITNIATQAKLTFDRTGSDTFVFWPQPDVHRTINLIAARQKQLVVAYPPAGKASASTALQDYFSHTQGWINGPDLSTLTLAEKKQRAQGAQNSVKISDLPPELRSSAQGEFVERLRTSSLAPDSSWLDLPSWKDAHVRFEKDSYNIYDQRGQVTHQEPVFVLYVYFPDGRYRTYIGAPHAANPHQGALANFKMPSWVSEGEHTSQFKTDDIPLQATPVSALPALDLDTQTELQKNVTFEGKRLSLHECVTSLSEQIGVALSVAPDVAPKAQVFACSGGAKASVAMSALERLYSARWTKNDNGYILQSQGLDELHQTLSRWGLWTSYDYNVRPPHERDAIGAQVADEVAGVLDHNQLLSKEGAPFSDLPLDAQSHVLQLFREDKIGILLITQQRAEEGLSYINDFQVRLSPLLDKTPRLFGAFYSRQADTGFLSEQQTSFGAYTPDGRFIIQLFTDFLINPPTASDAEQGEVGVATQVAPEQKEPQPKEEQVP